jgi:hypothetical protein
VQVSKITGLVSGVRRIPRWRGQPDGPAVIGGTPRRLCAPLGTAVQVDRK